MSPVSISFNCFTSDRITHIPNVQISDVTNQLFPSIPPQRLTTFSCGHIVPPNNLQTLVVKKGPKSSQMQFKYDSRNDHNLVRVLLRACFDAVFIVTQMAELGQVIFNFTNVVPGGMVVFVPSYSFLHNVVVVWEKSGLMERLQSKKKVFTEPQDSGEVETVLRDYAAEIEAVSVLPCYCSSELTPMTRRDALQTLRNVGRCYSRSSVPSCLKD